MGMSQEHAAAAFHAAKMAQLNAMGHNLDKLPPGLLPPHLDLSKVNNSSNLPNNQTSPNHHSTSDVSSRIQSSGGSITIEPTNTKVPTSMSHHLSSMQHDRADIRRESEPMDLGYDNNQLQHHNLSDNRSAGGAAGGGNSSGEEDNYSDDETDRIS